MAIRHFEVTKTRFRFKGRPPFKHKQSLDRCPGCGTLWTEHSWISVTEGDNSITKELKQHSVAVNMLNGFGMLPMCDNNIGRAYNG